MWTATAAKQASVCIIKVRIGSFLLKPVSVGTYVT